MRAQTRSSDESPGGSPSPAAARSGGRRSVLGLVVGTGLALAAQGAAAQQFQYVITFDNVTVRLPVPHAAPPSLAHAERLVSESVSAVAEATERGEALDRPGALHPPSPGASPSRDPAGRPDPPGYPRRDGPEWEARPPSPGASPSRDPAGRPDPPGYPRRDAQEWEARVSAGPPRDPATGLPVPHLAFAPGAGTANPSFVESGFLVEAFWSVKTGTGEGRFIRAHFHPPDLATGFEGQHWGYGNELHGIYVRAVDGKPFRLKSLRYRVTRNRQIPERPHSIHGYTNFSVQVLVGTSFDPRRSVRGQLTGFLVGPPLGNDAVLPWWTLLVFGFERVTEVYIASSASVDLDDIVVARWEEAPGTPSDAAPAPEPESVPSDQEAPAGRDQPSEGTR